MSAVLCLISAFVFITIAGILSKNLASSGHIITIEQIGAWAGIVVVAIALYQTMLSVLPPLIPPSSPVISTIVQQQALKKSAYRRNLKLGIGAVLIGFALVIFDLNVFGPTISNKSQTHGKNVKTSSHQR